MIEQLRASLPEEAGLACWPVLGASRSVAAMGGAGLRIIHVVSSLEGGGLEHFVLRLAEAQRRHGHDASVVAVRPGPLEAIAAERGLPVTVLSRAGKAARIAHAIGLFARRAPQVIHAHNPTVLQYATLAKLAAVLRPRLVFTDHAQSRGIVRVGSAFEWGFVDAFTAVSTATARRAGEIGWRGPVEVVGNGVASTPARRARADVRAELGISGRIVATQVANLDPVKDQATLLRAASELRARGVAVTALLVGEGPERPRLEALARSLGLGATEVRLLGFRSDVPDLLEASDIFVLPSRAEGLPISILEAMTHGLPIVCTPVGGNVELVEDGAEGRFVPVGDPNALAAALAALALDPRERRRQGDAARRRALRDHSLDRAVTRYAAIYSRTAGAAGAPARWGLGGARSPEGPWQAPCPGCACKCARGGSTSGRKMPLTPISGQERT
jgi:glycosyltransferase involved in cell wall biosynthesis